MAGFCRSNWERIHALDTIGMFNSGAQGDDTARIPALHGPVLLINGHERDFARVASKATFDAIETLPVFYGARHGAGHMGTIDHPGGGEFADVASNWLRWQFKRDTQAAKMFVRQGLQPLHEPELGHSVETAAVALVPERRMEAAGSSPTGRRPRGCAVAIATWRFGGPAVLSRR